MRPILKKLPIATFCLLLACGSKDDEGMPVDVFPELTINSVSKFEGDVGVTTFDFKVRLSQVSSNEVAVDFKTGNSSAEAGNDFVEKLGTVVFAPGTTEVIIPIEVQTDTLQEADEEFLVELENPSKAVITQGTGIGTIRNDDDFLPTSDDGFTSPLNYPGYTLVWQDEFNGSAIDASVWTHELGNSGWGNNESQNYTASSSNSFVSDGKLVIVAKKESSGGSDYSSARLITKDKQEFQFGRIDIRAKLPEGQGIWPALWMLGRNFSTVGWPDCGEIDIMEIVGHEPATTHGTVHWDNNGSYASFGGSKTLAQGKFADEFHVFSIVWDSQSIKWLLDNVQFNEIDISAASFSEFKQPFFFIFNVAVGGNWPGYPDATTVFPQRMVVDYVRVFQ